MFFIVLLCLPSKAKGKKPTSKKGGRKPKEVGKIYKTTDGALRGKPLLDTKKRAVVVTQRRRKDGALGVNKIHKLEGRNPQDKVYIQDLVLSPKDHPSLTKESIVEKRTLWGKNKNSTPIYKGDLTPTADKLTRKEYKKVRKGLGGQTKKNKKTYKRTLRNWQNGFKNKKKK
ncbi:MAG: hypothetical protein NC132_01470 [Corallococcus sp.]|nr:hypothetical protein [Corallococcus sp.]MCM1394770.1 hypothetical protein [Corallococcus sp.]